MVQYIMVGLRYLPYFPRQLASAEARWSDWCDVSLGRWGGAAPGGRNGNSGKATSLLLSAAPHCGPYPGTRKGFTDKSDDALLFIHLHSPHSSTHALALLTKQHSPDTPCIHTPTSRGRGPWGGCTRDACTFTSYQTIAGQPRIGLWSVQCVTYMQHVVHGLCTGPSPSPLTIRFLGLSLS
jgi:hypothetical protein